MVSRLTNKIRTNINYNQTYLVNDFIQVKSDKAGNITHAIDPKITGRYDFKRRLELSSSSKVDVAPL